MSEWIVRIRVDTGTELDERTLVALADAAERRNASVSKRAEGPGFTVTVDVKAIDPLAAGQDGAQVPQLFA